MSISAPDRLSTPTTSAGLRAAIENAWSGGYSPMCAATPSSTGPICTRTFERGSLRSRVRALPTPYQRGAATTRRGRQACFFREGTSCRLPGRSGLRRRVTGLRAILFDFGGTLDGAGRSWADRFVEAYDAHRLAVPPERLRAATSHGTRQSSRNPPVRGYGF